MKYHIKDIKLAETGRNRIEWAEKEMPVILSIRKRFSANKPLKGTKIGCCLHVTSETANLLITLKSAGANIAVCASNPLSTQNDVAAALVKFHDIPVFAIKGENTKTYYNHILQVLSFEPHITIDDGADLVTTYHKNGFKFKIIGGTEETTTGVNRLKIMEKDGVLKYPIIAVNDAQTKYLFDNRYGTGQSTIDGILRLTNILISGKSVVVCGYGWCGKGLASKLKGLGANVIVVEIDPIKALEAVMDGFQVMNSIDAAKVGDIFITVTGNINVLSEKHFRVMKNGAILANSGHFNVEIDIPSLEKMSMKIRKIKDGITEYTLYGNKKLFLLTEGRLVNLAGAEGHPACVMDMSFSNQALCVEYLKKNAHKLENKVYKVPEEIDREVALIKLKSMGIKTDKLTPQQKKYITSWELGT